MEEYTHHFLNWWMNARLTDFAHLLLAVVLVGWALIRVRDW